MALQLRQGRASSFAKLTAMIVTVFAFLVQLMVTMSIPQAFADSAAVDISTVAQLREAIENQADGQTWTIHPGNYGLSAFNDISASGQTGWYFPITASNLTIKGVGNPILYGTGYTANGNWSTQNFVSVFGDNVTLEGLTLMPKVEPNKTVEVLGSNFTFRNSTITPNTLTDLGEYSNINDPSDPAWSEDAKQWGGSLYFSHAGNHTVENVTIKNAGISYRYAPSGTNVTFTNVKLVNTTAIDWINGYRYSSGFNNPGNSTTGQPIIEYHVSSALGNLATVLAQLKDGDTVVLDSDLQLSQQLTLNKSVTFDGNGHTLKPTFTKTDTSNNSALGIQANDVMVMNLVVDGGDGTNLHGINVYQSANVALNSVSSKNNDNSGIVVNGSKVTVTDVTTAGNGWHGINVDKTGAVLTVNGTSHQADALPIYLDDKAVAQVVDTNHQYASRDDFGKSGDRLYYLPLAAPTTPYPASGAAIATNDFWFTWSSVAGAASYEWQGSTSSVTNAEGNLANIMWTGDYQQHQPTGPTAHSVGASGTWYWQVRAVDTLGNKGKWSSVWDVTVDTSTPAVPSNLAWVSSNGSSANNGLTNIQKGTLSWSDAAPSDVDHYIYNFWTDIPGYFEGQANAWKTSESQYITTTATGGSIWTDFADKEGTYYFCVQAVDRAGNASGCSNTLAIHYDATAPVATITAPVDGSGVNGTVTITGTVADANPMNSYFSIYNASNVLVASSLKTDGSTIHSFTWNTASLPDGQYTIFFETRDKLGNKDGTIAAPATSVKKITVTVDRTKPAAPVFGVTGYNSGDVMSQYAITAVWTKPSADTVKYEYQYWNDITGNQYKEATPYQVEVSAESLPGVFNQGEGTHYMRVRAIDAVGNKSDWSNVFALTYDVSAPVVTVNAISAVTEGGDTSISGTVNDPSVTTVEVFVDGVSKGQFAVTDGSFTAAVTLTKGSHAVVVTAKDTAGNSGSSEAQTAVVDEDTTNPISPALTTGNGGGGTVQQQIFTLPLALDSDAAVLGAQDSTVATDTDTSKAVDQEVKGTQTAAKVVDKATQTGSGVAWYWWLLGLAALASLLWWLLAWRRRRNEEE